MRSALVVSPDADAYHRIDAALEDHNVRYSESIDAALSAMSGERFDLIFQDLTLLRQHAGGDGYGAGMKPFWRLFPAIEIIVIIPRHMIRDGVMAVKAGASDYITLPVDPDEVRHVTDALYEDRQRASELDYLRRQTWEDNAQNMLYTHSPAMRQVLEKLRSAAPTMTTVMLYGETGVGKGVMASWIHRQSNRKDGPLISVHCGALPDTLLESELFGHEKGAFTGAVRRKPGKFEIAEGGTIFLDEIGTISQVAQIKLLQVLQERIFQRVGGEALLKADARIIAASNADLKEMSDSGDFRRDLYYRLNVFPVEIPPLRKRKEDIPSLVDFFIRKLNLQYGKEIRRIHPAVIEAFSEYDWPGNIRELENLVERAYILEKSSTLTPETFPEQIFPSSIPSASIHFDDLQTLSEVRKKALESVERQYLKKVLSRNSGKINTSAADAGISTRQFHKLLTKYGIQKERFKNCRGGG